MRETSVSSILTVCFDGQFWVGTVEHAEDGRLSACRIVFGAEPSNEKIQEFVLRRWSSLSFSDPVAFEKKEMAGNPKRRQRQAAKEMGRTGASTKARLALAEQHEAQVEARKSAMRESRKAALETRFKLKTERRKEKKRGH